MRVAGFLAVLLALTLVGCEHSDTEATSQRTGPARFADVEGRWEGALRQEGMRPFPIEVTIRSEEDPADNAVTYGGEIGCSGTWSYRGGDSTTVEFDEVIRSGRGGACKGSGTVSLGIRPGGKLSYVFSGGGVESHGVLRRTD